MNKLQLELLIKAGTVRKASIVQREPGAFEAWINYGGEDLASSGGEPIHTARGAVRRWSDLGTAYGFLRTCGYRGAVEVEDGGPAYDLVVEPTQAGQWRWAVLENAVEFSGGGGYETEDEARAEGESELYALARPSGWY